MQLKFRSKSNKKKTIVSSQ